MHCEEYQQEQICPYCWMISPKTYAHRQHIAYAHTMERVNMPVKGAFKYLWGIWREVGVNKIQKY